MEFLEDFGVVDAWSFPTYGVNGWKSEGAFAARASGSVKKVSPSALGPTRQPPGDVLYSAARLHRGLSTTTVTPRLLGTRRFHSCVISR